MEVFYSKTCCTKSSSFHIANCSGYKWRFGGDLGHQVHSISLDCLSWRSIGWKPDSVYFLPKWAARLLPWTSTFLKLHSVLNGILEVFHTTQGVKILSLKEMENCTTRMEFFSCEYYSFLALTFSQIEQVDGSVRNHKKAHLVNLLVHWFYLYWDLPNSTSTPSGTYALPDTLLNLTLFTIMQYKLFSGSSLFLLAKTTWPSPCFVWKGAGSFSTKLA